MRHEINISLTTDDDGGNVVAHRIDCPVVQKHREDGKPIMNMFGCKEPLPVDIRKHTCLDK